MKRLTLLVLLFLYGNLLAQETLTVKEFLSRKDASETGYAVKGRLVDVVDRMSGIDFILRDETEKMRVQLARNGVKTDLVFRLMDIRPGDTLSVAGLRGRVAIPGQGSKWGMIRVFIRSRNNSKEHALAPWYGKRKAPEGGVVQIPYSFQEKPPSLGDVAVRNYPCLRFV